MTRTHDRRQGGASRGLSAALLAALLLPASAAGQVLGVDLGAPGEPTATSRSTPPSLPEGYRVDWDVEWPVDPDLSDDEVDVVLRRFVTRVVRELQADPAVEEITYAVLLTRLGLRWIRETPYRSNAQESHTLGTLRRGWTETANDYRRIVREGWGVCGDFQQLLLRLVDLALELEACAPLRGRHRHRLQPIDQVAGGGDLEDSNHGAVGLVDAAVAAELPTSPGTDYPVLASLRPGDVRVWDLWAATPVLGEEDARAWAVSFSGSHRPYRSATVFFGDFLPVEWSLRW